MMLETKRKKSREKQKRSGVTAADILVPLGLILLSIVPAIGGTVRLVGLAADVGMTAENARFYTMPLPVSLHIVGAVLYSLLGILQFTPRFRRRWFRLHVWFGRILIPSGFVVALTGLWMAHFYPWPPLDGTALYVMRLVVGAGMVLSLGLAIRAIRQRRFRVHGAWMIRAYALAMGAGSQVFTHLPLMIFPDALNETTRAIAMGAGWLINMLVAEWVIARHKTRVAVAAG